MPITSGWEQCGVKDWIHIHRSESSATLTRNTLIFWLPFIGTSCVAGALPISIEGVWDSLRRTQNCLSCCWVCRATEPVISTRDLVPNDTTITLKSKALIGTCNVTYLESEESGPWYKPWKTLILTVVHGTKQHLNKEGGGLYFKMELRKGTRDAGTKGSV